MKKLEEENFGLVLVEVLSFVQCLEDCWHQYSRVHQFCV